MNKHNDDSCSSSDKKFHVCSACHTHNKSESATNLTDVLFMDRQLIPNDFKYIAWKAELFYKPTVCYIKPCFNFSKYCYCRTTMKWPAHFVGATADIGYESELASVLHQNDIKKLKMKWDEGWINKLKWSWFKVPAKVKQVNEYLFSDTAQSEKSGSDKISQGQYRGYPSKCNPIATGSV